jgi:hypothetical protein
MCVIIGPGGAARVEAPQSQSKCNWTDDFADILGAILDGSSGADQPALARVNQ